MKTIVRGEQEMLKMHPDGKIERPGLLPSEDWRIVGAIRFNSFGRPVEHYTLDEIQEQEIQWKYKNGKQRVHLIDFDHGTHRVWHCPAHFVY